jgi:pullulanase
MFRAGAFNDRFRDAAMGGSPFADPTLQGFLTGLYTDPCPPGAPNSNPADLQHLQSNKTLLKLSMAANLRDYVITLPDGSKQRGCETRYGHFPAAYCKLPQENVLYLGCHDNEALYDQTVLKVNHKGEAQTCKRVVELALGVIGVSQGIAFFHAGDDLLRSKSLDRDSYNSGDWFNKLIWDCSSNNFGVRPSTPPPKTDTTI